MIEAGSHAPIMICERPAVFSAGSLLRFISLKFGVLTHFADCRAARYGFTVRANSCRGG